MSKVSFWNGNHPLQHVSQQLDTLIPDMGECENARTSNKKLEKFRKASNCYYDLYNNGLFNRASEFRKVFGIASTAYKTYDDFKDELYVLVNDKMAEIVREAAIEQKINLPN